MGTNEDTPAARREEFSTTQWSLVLRAGCDHSPESSEALEELCRKYWLSLYAFARRLGHAAEAAQDLTQGFFAHFLERTSIQAADPERGRFRTFLLTSFQRFITGEWEKARATKRGGKEIFIPLEDWLRAEESQPALNAQSPPDKVYDRQWAGQIFSRALRRLREEHTFARKALEFERLKEFLSQPGDTGVYAERARELGCKPETVAVAVHRLRKRFGELLRGEIAHTVSTLEDLEAEVRYLIEVLSE